MFGTHSTQPINDDPAMLDSVKQLTADPTATIPSVGSAISPTPATPAATVSKVAPAAAPVPPKPVAKFSSTPPVTVAPAQPAATASPTPAPVVTQPVVVDTATSPAPKPVATAVDQEQLAGMKQHALDHLEPLVDHLDQNAEEEFKTTMMMIQSNDNHTLLEKALESAKKISDDKQRAEALLDIINEINYFATQHNS